MTLSRCILPGQTVMLTRRCLRCTKLLRPDAASQLDTYRLAIMASLVRARRLSVPYEHLIVRVAGPAGAPPPPRADPCRLPWGNSVALPRRAASPDAL